MAMMNCKPFGFNELKAKLAARLATHNPDDEQPNEAILDVLRGEVDELIAHARLNGAYTDRTGNLRASIGCDIYFNGRKIESHYDGSTTQGEQRCIETLADYALQNPDKISDTGYTLLLVAGMNYARAVESKGYNVLHLTIQKAEADVKAIRKKLQSLTE